MSKSFDHRRTWFIATKQDIKPPKTVIIDVWTFMFHGDTRSETGVIC